MIKSSMKHPDQLTQVREIKWEGLTNTEEAEARTIPFRSDKTVSVTGEFGGATVSLKGSNDGSFWKTLTDAQGNDISFTSDDMAIILENPLYIKPVATGGDGTQDVETIIIAVGE